MQQQQKMRTIINNNSNNNNNNNHNKKTTQLNKKQGATNTMLPQTTAVSTIHPPRPTTTHYLQLTTILSINQHPVQLHYSATRSCSTRRMKISATSDTNTTLCLVQHSVMCLAPQLVSDSVSHSEHWTGDYTGDYTRYATWNLLSHE